MNTKDPITQQIKEARINRGLSVPQLADLLGIPMDRVYKWEQGKGAPKFKDRQIVGEWLNNPDWKKVPDEKKNTSVIPEGSAESDFLKAITALTESNQGLVENNKAVTDTNRVIADTNAILAQKLVTKDSSLAEEDRQTMDETVATVIALKESIVEITALLKKVSNSVASREFHNRVSAAKRKIASMDSRAEAGK